MGDDLANEVNALQPATLVDALIRAKAKLSSKTKLETSTNKRPAGNDYGSENRNVRRHLSGATQNQGPFNQPARVQANALPINQIGRML